MVQFYSLLSDPVDKVSRRWEGTDLLGFLAGKCCSRLIVGINSHLGIYFTLLVAVKVNEK